MKELKDIIMSRLQYLECYDNTQLSEIEKGLEQGVEISRYISPEFNGNQMEQIRLGLEEKIDISKYADSKFSHTQMEQIRKGIALGLDVDVYANNEFNAEQMDFIRRQLMKKISPVDMIGEEIAVHKEPEDSTIFIYAKPEYSVRKMQEIMKGLESGIEIEKILHPEWSVEYMTLIRMGLEKGKDLTDRSEQSIGTKNVEDLINMLNENNRDEVVRLFTKGKISNEVMELYNFLTQHKKK